ncbi:DUF4397 domain-containing protein [Natronosporangium hydrolyticum]|uniref:DUF4397 domain-containing protein n=1 Tax=Natronosporangium hydrolyticum TaxID=2811111 RepID=A0A895Y8J1_9ACTN|nr:DUF4397 domain-containing protein [Natronosporangium hydrolyticum]QSB13661.1 DUF4397 domain-containing protein [Natronosporangium hydrolyticum]
MRFNAHQWWRNGAVVAAAAALAVTGAAGSVSAQEDQQNDESQVYVVHGIPEQDVDVYVDQELTVESFAPGDITGPLELAGGTYTIALTEPGGSVDDPLISSDVDVPSGENVSLAAHLSEDGEPTLTAFVNDLDELPSDQARLTVRHVAAAPAVNVLLNGEEAFTDLTNPNEDTQDVPAETASVEVVLANGSDPEDTQDPVLGPTDLTLTEGTLNVAYAIGSADDDTLELVVQVIEDPEGGMPSPSPTPTPNDSGE